MQKPRTAIEAHSKTRRPGVQAGSGVRADHGRKNAADRLERFVR